MCVLDSGQPTAVVWPGRSVCGGAWNQEALFLQTEVPPGLAETVGFTSLSLFFKCRIYSV